MSESNAENRRWRYEGWDYRKPWFYMITATVANRQPILAHFTPEGNLERSRLGDLVAHHWLRLKYLSPCLDPQKYIVMPDHFHGIIRVVKRLDKHLGDYIREFKAACTREFAALGGSPDLSLWNAGYDDLILKNAGQLKAMNHYIADNPRRLWMKRIDPELFREVRGIKAAGIAFNAIGNRFLLDRPNRLQVRVSRRVTSEELERIKASFLAEARRGAVLVSPVISAGEKAVARAALEEGLALIVLLENGFSPYYKPHGQYFDACAAGRLLMLAPWPHHADNRAINRAQCEALNSMAAAIAAGGG